MNNMNFALEKDERISQIRAIPLLTGVKTEKVVIKMNEMPTIPDNAMTYEKMGEFMDSYQMEIKDNALKPLPNSKIEKQWQRMKSEADNEIGQIDDEYQMLLREVEEMTNQD
mgnify:CR=1 FL=1